MGNIRIALVDDQQLFRQGIASIVNQDSEFELCLHSSARPNNNITSHCFDRYGDAFNGWYGA
jgi:DNA-binding NarL/FixJ family response regulator